MIEIEDTSLIACSAALQQFAGSHMIQEVFRAAPVGLRHGTRLCDDRSKEK
jgi:hypothetical protein